MIIDAQFSVEIDGEKFIVRNFDEQILVWRDNSEIIFFDREIISGTFDVIDANDYFDTHLSSIKKEFLKNLDKFKLALEKYNKLSSLI